MGPPARLINRLGGNFRWQHLPVPFEVYADGIDLVVFEEFGAGAAALHLRDELERNELLRDESYRREFRKQYESKFGCGCGTATSSTPRSSSAQRLR